MKIIEKTWTIEKSEDHPEESEDRPDIRAEVSGRKKDKKALLSSLNVESPSKHDAESKYSGSFTGDANIIKHVTLNEKKKPVMFNIIINQRGKENKITILGCRRKVDTSGNIFNAKEIEWDHDIKFDTRSWTMETEKEGEIQIHGKYSSGRHNSNDLSEGSQIDIIETTIVTKTKTDEETKDEETKYEITSCYNGTIKTAVDISEFENQGLTLPPPLLGLDISITLEQKVPGGEEIPFTELTRCKMAVGLEGDCHIASYDAREATKNDEYTVSG